MKSFVNSLLIGGSGIGASEVVQVVAENSQDKTSTIITIIVQIVIGISTLLGLFKKKTKI